MIPENAALWDARSPDGYCLARWASHAPDELAGLLRAGAYGHP